MRALVWVWLLAGCGSPTEIAPDLAMDLGIDLTVPDLYVDKAAACVSDMWGSSLTSSFGRLDGIMIAAVKPSDQQCDRPNAGHVVVEVLALGGVYRMVVNVMSTSVTDPRTYETEIQHALPGAPWSEGWHPTETLDYVALGVHKPAFQPYDLDPLADRIATMLPLDGKVSFYATSSGGDSAHLVHRNLANADGAIVLDPESPSPTWMLFAFDNTPLF